MELHSLYFMLCFADAHMQTAVHSMPGNAKADAVSAAVTL